MPRQLTFLRTGFGVLLLWHAMAAMSADGTDDLAGSAFVGRDRTPEEIAYQPEVVRTAKAYGECLQAAGDRWFSEPDYTVCDGLRGDYQRLLAEEIADHAVGCLEEGVLGRPRTEGLTCASLRARFPIVTSWPTDEELAP